MSNADAMNMQDSTAVAVVRAHIDAWSHHDWEKTRELLAPNVHAVVTTTEPMRAVSEFTGIDTYMERKIRGAQLVEPGSAQVISSIGDERNALILVHMSIGLGQDGAMVTLARAVLCSLDENEKIIEERDEYSILSPNIQDSTAVTVARAHINAWSHSDWEKTRELVAPDVHVVAVSTQPTLPSGEASGIDNYMPRLINTAPFIEPGSVQVISAVGDERNALVLETMRMALGPNGSMVNFVRASLYLLDEKEQIKEERDEFCVLSS